MTDQTPDTGPEFPQDAASSHNGSSDSGGLPQIASMTVEEDDAAGDITMPDAQISPPAIKPSVSTKELDPDEMASESRADQPASGQESESDLPPADFEIDPVNEPAADPNAEPVKSQSSGQDLERDPSPTETADEEQTGDSSDKFIKDLLSENVEPAAAPDKAASDPPPSDMPEPSSDSSQISVSDNEQNGGNEVDSPERPSFGKLIAGETNQEAPSAPSPTASPATDPWNNASVPPPVQPVETDIPPIPVIEASDPGEDDANLIRILYVEDNPDNQILVQRVLLFEGFDIDFAQNAEETLKISENNTYDLILMDINLPDIDGYTLTSILRKTTKFSNVPIIALTANVMKGDRELSLEAGCDGYIQKPVNIDELPGQIKGFLSSR